MAPIPDAANGIAKLQVQLEKTFAGKWTNVEVDNLGNLYLVDDQQRIKKLNNRYDSVGTFNEVRTVGTLHSIDVSNPLRIILWYKDFGTLLLLDRFLQVKTSIDLRNIGLLQCNAVAQSYDNNIWVYDDLSAQIKKINEEGKVLLESPDMRVLYDMPPHPQTLTDFNRNLYAYDADNGLLICDYFGAVQKSLPYKGWKNLQGFGRGLLATNEDVVTWLSSNGIDTKKWELPAGWWDAQKIRFYQNKVYVLRNNQLYAYALTQALE
ncbi:hypothetical protein [Phnomibacter ginsenosidimutans]|uniref:Uncharacterized protein n=1 Tax=Phnomibacter ginsenosidimutans TaxID=2676868 RepID=A0A6I6G6S7_9BACT|nr:hypothetical protein [Phnomibacter ginsenosidimutans]QGW27143.1 hypothetical protein GLV81_02640 [Phnomibacter ginsenosidimutans]